MNLVISVKDDLLKATFAGYPTRLLEELVKAMNRYTVSLQATTKGKLNDDVLRVRSGTLERSINREVTETVSSVTGIVGTPVRYGSVHEYGFHGTVSVPEHTRRVTSDFKTLKSTSRARIGPIGEKRLRYINGLATVRAHMMKMNLPERSFLRSSLKETQPLAERLFAEAALRALKK